MRFVLLIVIGGATIGIAMNASHEFLAPFEENIVWMKEGKLESTPSAGAQGGGRFVIPPGAFAFAPAPDEPPLPAEPDRGSDASAFPDVNFRAEIGRPASPESAEQPTGVIRMPQASPVSKRLAAASYLFHLPVVVDGGRLRSGETLIVLDGIKPFRRSRLCRNGEGQLWRCGQRAAAALSGFIRRRSIECDPAASGRPRTIAAGLAQDAPYRARCRVNGVDLAGWLVRNGWADAADPRFAADADAALRDRLGQWGSDFGE